MAAPTTPASASQAAEPPTLASLWGPPVQQPEGIDEVEAAKFWPPQPSSRQLCATSERAPDSHQGPTGKEPSQTGVFEEAGGSPQRFASTSHEGGPERWASSAPESLPRGGEAAKEQALSEARRKVRSAFARQAAASSATAPKDTYAGTGDAKSSWHSAESTPKVEPAGAPPAPEAELGSLGGQEGVSEISEPPRRRRKAKASRASRRSGKHKRKAGSEAASGSRGPPKLATVSEVEPSPAQAKSKHRAAGASAPAPPKKHKRKRQSHRRHKKSKKVSRKAKARRAATPSSTSGSPSSTSSSYYEYDE